MPWLWKGAGLLPADPENLFAGLWWVFEDARWEGIAKGEGVVLTVLPGEALKPGVWALWPKDGVGTVFDQDGGCGEENPEVVQSWTPPTGPRGAWDELGAGTEGPGA